MKSKAKRSLSLLMLTLTLIMSLELPAFAACNHQWTAWEIEMEETCGEPGRKIRYCTECYQDEYQNIPATGRHVWSDWEVETDATCIEAGEKSRECEECGKCEYKTIPATGKHVWTNWITETAASCIEAGTKSRFCMECFKDNYQIIPATGKHDWGSWETLKKPTYYKEGKEVRYCYECDKKQTKAIPKNELSKTEKKAVSAATDLLKYAKKYDVKNMKKQFVSPPKDLFFEKKVALAKYCKKYNQKTLSSKVRSVSINQKDATVKLDVTYPDAYYPFGYSYYDLVNYIIQHPKCSEKTMFKKYMKYLSRYTKIFGVGKETKTITFKLKKTKKGWKITKSSDDIKNAINCNHEEAYSDVLG